MSRLTWNNLEDIKYEDGLDRGVFYASYSYAGVPWNGLISVEENISDSEYSEFYYDGVKRRQSVDLGVFSGTLTAYTYPKEFMEFDGFDTIVAKGIYLDGQSKKTFDLSYRTKVGNPSEGLDYGYKIHLLYNLVTDTASNSRETISEDVSPDEFSWNIESVPLEIEGCTPTAHIIIDSTLVYPPVLEIIEEILYGTELDAPRMVTPADLTALSIISVTDNGDGTYTVVGPDANIYPIDVMEYALYMSRIHILDDDSYTLSSS